MEAHLDQWVDHANVGTGVKHFAEACLSVDQLQLVELLVILAENSLFLGNFWVFLFASFLTKLQRQTFL